MKRCVMKLSYSCNNGVRGAGFSRASIAPHVVAPACKHNRQHNREYAR